MANVRSTNDTNEWQDDCYPPNVDRVMGTKANSADLDMTLCGGWDYGVTPGPGPGPIPPVVPPGGGVPPVAPTGPAVFVSAIVGPVGIDGFNGVIVTLSHGSVSAIESEWEVTISYRPKAVKSADIIGNKMYIEIDAPGIFAGDFVTVSHLYNISSVAEFHDGTVINNI